MASLRERRDRVAHVLLPDEPAAVPARAARASATSPARSPSELWETRPLPALRDHADRRGDRQVVEQIRALAPPSPLVNIVHGPPRPPLRPDLRRQAVRRRGALRARAAGRAAGPAARRGVRDAAATRASSRALGWDVTGVDYQRGPARARARRGRDRVASCSRTCASSTSPGAPLRRRHLPVRLDRLPAGQRRRRRGARGAAAGTWRRAAAWRSSSCTRRRCSRTPTRCGCAAGELPDGGELAARLGDRRSTRRAMAMHVRLRAWSSCAPTAATRASASASRTASSRVEEMRALMRARRPARRALRAGLRRRARSAPDTFHVIARRGGAA